MAPSASPTTLSPTTSIAPSQSPTIFCEAECSFIDGVLRDQGELINGRLRRNETTSSCENRKPYPGSFGDVDRYYERIGPFCNKEPEETCVTVTWDFGTCEQLGDVQVHPVAYSEFNPLNMSEGYLGDNGPSLTPRFSFFVPGLSTFEMIFQQVFPGPTGIGCSFRFRVDFGFCINQVAEYQPIYPDQIQTGRNNDTDLPEEEFRTATVGGPTAGGPKRLRKRMGNT